MYGEGWLLDPSDTSAKRSSCHVSNEVSTFETKVLTTHWQCNSSSWSLYKEKVQKVRKAEGRPSHKKSKINITPYFLGTRLLKHQNTIVDNNKLANKQTFGRTTSLFYKRNRRVCGKSHQSTLIIMLPVDPNSWSRAMQFTDCCGYAGDCVYL